MHPNDYLQTTIAKINRNIRKSKENRKNCSYRVKYPPHSVDMTTYKSILVSLITKQINMI